MPQSTAFWFSSLCVRGVFQVIIEYKSKRSKKGQQLSLDSSNANIRRPFGPITQCSHLLTSTANDENKEEFQLWNERNQTTKLNCSMYNNICNDLNSFNQKLQELSIKNKDLLAFYISKLNYAEKFIYHSEDIHNSDGFCLDQLNEESEKMNSLGGSVQEYNSLVELAMKFSIVITDDSPRSPLKRKPTSLVREQLIPDRLPKMSKKNSMEYFEIKELERADGLEKIYSSSYKGISTIKLENISVSEEMKSLISSQKVNVIKEEILRMYEPRELVIVVCPCPVEEKETEKENSDDDVKYYVVQKLHTVVALKELLREDKLKDLTGIVDNEILCFVLKPISLEIMMYGNLKSNLIAARHNQKIDAQDLLHHNFCLLKGQQSSESIRDKIVDRMSKISKLRPEDRSALSRLVRWKEETFTNLIEVVNKFEHYSTLDANSPGSKKAISKGQKLKMSSTLFRNLSYVSEKFFNSEYNHVLDNKMSLKKLVENFQKELKIISLYSIIKEISCEQNISLLIKKYPGKFSKEDIEKFIGAKWTRDGERNSLGCELENYILSIINQNKEQIQLKVADVNNDFFEGPAITEADMIVYIMSGERKEEIIIVLATILTSVKGFISALLVFNSEAEYYNFLSFLRSSEDKILKKNPNFKHLPLAFKKINAERSQKITENIQYAILMGVYEHSVLPFYTCYDGIAAVEKVIENICPRNNNVAIIADKDIILDKVHNEKSSFNCTYYGNYEQLSKLNVDYLFDKHVLENTILDDSGISDVSTSHISEIVLDHSRSTVIETLNFSMHSSQNVKSSFLDKVDGVQNGRNQEDKELLEEPSKDLEEQSEDLLE